MPRTSRSVTDLTTHQILRGTRTVYVTPRQRDQDQRDPRRDHHDDHPVTRVYPDDSQITRPGFKVRIRCLESRDQAGKHAGRLYDADAIERELETQYHLTDQGG